ncbi:hypothetical protein Tco_1336210 [Tanacetum coccineum]
MTEHPDISRRVHDNYHNLNDDDLVKNIFNFGKNKERTGMRIPAWMLTKEMKLTAHYQMLTSIPRTPNPEVTKGESSAQRKSTVIRLRVPLRRQDLETPIPTAAEIDATNLAETIQMMDGELDQLLNGAENVDVDAIMDDVLNNQEDPDTRIEPRSDKESLEVEKKAIMVTISNDDAEEELAGDEFKLRRR